MARCHIQTFDAIGFWDRHFVCLGTRSLDHVFWFKDVHWASLTSLIALCSLYRGRRALQTIVRSLLHGVEWFDDLDLYIVKVQMLAASRDLINRACSSLV